MNDRINVINGLQNCLDCNCDDCTQEDASGYPWDCTAYYDLICHALQLLKEQEPRVLTLEEVKDKYEVVWLETKYLQPTVCLVDNGESDADWLYVVFGVDDSHPMPCRFYGKGWRCWSARPTDEQREATPWRE